MFRRAVAHWVAARVIVMVKYKLGRVCYDASSQQTSRAKHSDKVVVKSKITCEEKSEAELLKC